MRSIGVNSVVSNPMSIGYTIYGLGIPVVSPLSTVSVISESTWFLNDWFLSEKFHWI